MTHPADYQKTLLHQEACRSNYPSCDECPAANILCLLYIQEFLQAKSNQTNETNQTK